MNARDLMSHDTVTVHPDTPLRDVARTLLEHQVSAVPVVDSGGEIVGMVSEGDLVGRKKTERETRSEWWLERLAEGESINTQFLEHLQSPLAVAREVMSQPVLTIGEETKAEEIANLMGTHRIKRLPVVRDGRLVGVVRRADLLRTLGGGKFAPVPLPPTPLPGQAWVEHGRPAGGDGHAPPAPPPLAPTPTPDAELTVDDFRHLVAHHQDELAREHQRQRELATRERRENLRRLIDTHISDMGWNGLIHLARQAAERGETEFLLLRFPSQLCSDGGRAVNAPDPDWPRSLRGEAAEMYLRWERELRPRGFHILARVLEFPNGTPGDIGLFLTWRQ
jgi:CBS domain-containing protein